MEPNVNFKDYINNSNIDPEIIDTLNSFLWFWEHSKCGEVHYLGNFQWFMELPSTCDSPNSDRKTEKES